MSAEENSRFDASALAPPAETNGIDEPGHFIQFYEEDAFLLDTVARFIGGSLEAGGGDIVIATRPHLDGIEKRLTVRGLDLAAARERGHYVTLDAAETLSMFMSDGSPDPRRFADAVAPVVTRMIQDRGPRVRVFGEMVALLCAEGNLNGALHLEELWNDLGSGHSFSLLCAYPLQAFARADDWKAFVDTCRKHSRVIPTERYVKLPTPAERLRIITELQQKAQFLETEVAHRKQIGEALRRKEEALSDFLENSTIGLNRVGPDGMILWANKGELAMLGYAPGEYIGHHIAEFHVDRPAIDEILQTLSRGETLHHHPARLRCKDGSIKHVLIDSTALWEDGKVVRTRCFTRDVTDRRKADEVSRRLTAIIESSDDAIVSKDLDGIITSWNPAAERMFGYTAAEAVGRSIRLIIPADRQHEEDEVLRRLRRGERIDHFETVRRCKDGTNIEISLTVSPIIDQDGRVIGASKIARDITDRKRGEAVRERLLAAEQALRAEAERTSRMKDEFLAILSHELRTPLTSMLGWTRVLRARKLDEMAEARALEAMERNTRLQAQLIDDLLDMSRIISGKLKIEREPVDLVSVIEAALENVRSAADAKSLQIATVLDPATRPVWGDVTRLQQVMWNLLSNAVKFTPPKGKIDVSLGLENDHARITVTDTGSGIPPEILPRIFDRFRQAEEPDTRRRHGGLGLGLAIARELVERHGGTLVAESPGAGWGSTFMVTLPTMAESVVRTPALSVDRYEASEEPVRLDGVRVLVVDDETDTRELLVTVLRNSGAAATDATSVCQALAALRALNPHVLISDIAMPNEDGYELIRKVRALGPSAGHIPAIALTAYARREDRQRALGAGYDLHLAKPVEPNDLVRAVANLVERRQR
jgi:PAS domain S-box-containing protein